MAAARAFLDVIGNEETLETERFEVVLTGFDRGTTCDTGAYDALGGCEFTRDDNGNEVAVIEPLAPARASRWTVATTAAATAAGPGATRRSRPGSAARVRDDPARTRGGDCGSSDGVVGSNNVLAGGAAEAAFGDLPVPERGSGRGGRRLDRVTDNRLAGWPRSSSCRPAGSNRGRRGVLREDVDDETVAAWFAEMIAQRHSWSPSAARMEPDARPEQDQLSPSTAHLDRLFQPAKRGRSAQYSPAFADVESRRSEQHAFDRYGGMVAQRWAGRIDHDSAKVVAVVALAVSSCWCSSRRDRLASRGLAVVGSPLFALIVGFLVRSASPCRVHGSLPSRTATGSALALRSESFRRFLAASEGKHVEWAWQQGLVREYSAWAVALGGSRCVVEGHLVEQHPRSVRGHVGPDADLHHGLDVLARTPSRLPRERLEWGIQWRRARAAAEAAVAPDPGDRPAGLRQ